ncbi:thiol reductase thioredoxin [Acinetobacter sp. LoGeW2-3]|uniref:thioredoxin family protein n=1 Tax=Acinetobacter sp. LoGeW2-3 TaxID=1808001 RepID=UPI000C05C16B|nr:thioredoxin family protein [Acinetobacter sp. LoGeW2-3]ATO18295.1 thiol reductase thioredoxin [Acinetobacter sp. LoGeW2-3]
MSAVTTYNEDNYREFEWFEGFAVIRFYADWCKPCMQNFPIFAELAAQYTEHKPEIKFGKVNVDQSPILTLRYNVYGLPSTLIFKNGQIIHRIAGVKSLGEMKAILSQVLDNFSD